MVRLRKSMGIVIGIIAWAVSVALIALNAWLYFPERYNPATGKWFDGLGRELHEGLPGMYGRDRTPGLYWEIVDTIIWLTLFAICWGLFALARRLKRHTDSSTSHL